MPQILRLPLRVQWLIVTSVGRAHIGETPSIRRDQMATVGAWVERSTPGRPIEPPPQSTPAPEASSPSIRIGRLIERPSSSARHSRR